ncbi:MAG: hypothetical protein A2315_08840 [Ignavibacteria bacterium RIFOXYB2_FULL_35_12]|nr:MAG: hypothetical protein A2058_08305 [Ignavibacteria bacterium GWA2_36_19]OGU51157.1 MAG: hypothetical protein A2006_02205 [Ignavibacteria bacterium GWC2_35_8]OGU59713.1 MAG: hypothetical protein A2X60_10120 [Ignavibacteria bacterium GWF2_35_20]OGU80616.1 MAG: hypothetical protein A2254_13305 [Ignavibacteria bacterium RIFOXYA2_FULL_35_9]OGU85181.1 MAG: hypothetical protein A3K31_11580 [Ignavibacteria bacterium RIFOXYA12_FULL_35_25]OGU91808.1 MAG: hypothetical protein A2492_07530 [Ignavibac
MALNRIEKRSQKGIQKVLKKIENGTFICKSRQAVGSSAIGKPVDLQISNKSTKRNLVAVEISNVNTTQLVGEATRLYFDSIPLKLLVLHRGNTPKNGKETSEKILCALYGQKQIQDTPSRVTWYNDKKSLDAVLRELLNKLT